MEAILINCNDCAHCVDLKTPSDTDAPTLTNARNKIKSIVTKWLTATVDNKTESINPVVVVSEEVFLQQ